MSQDSMCRVCLAVDVRMCAIAGTPLQLVYEKLTDAELWSNGRPMAACYICHALLRKSLRLMRTAAAAEEQLTAVMAEYSKMPAESVSLVDRHAAGLCGELTFSPTECTHTPPPVAIKEEESDVDNNNYDSEGSEPADLDMTEQSGSQGDPLSAAQPFKSEPFKDEETQEDGDVDQDSKSEIHEDDNPSERREARGDPPQTDEALVTKSRQRQRATDISGDETPEALSDATHTGDPHKSSPRSTRLQKRQRTHTGEEQHQCNLSQQMFPKLSNLRDHLVDHNDHRPYECNVCQNRFKRKADLENHVRTHTGEKPFECDVCKRKFSIKTNLQRHVKTHTGEKPFDCHICKKKFPSKHRLQRHIKIHTSEKPFQCNICKRSFSFKYDLQIHLKTHSGEKPFSCNICRKKFPIKNRLQRHLTIHTGEKPFECNICKVKFSLKTNLQRHVKTHTGEKTFFDCQICKKKFSTKSNLQKHSKRHSCKS